MSELGWSIYDPTAHLLSFTIRWGSVLARVWRYPNQTEGRIYIAFSWYGNTEWEET